jgi:hypothetical protein
MFKLFKKKRHRKKKEKIEVEKAGGIKIPPGFDSSLMKKLMKEGYKSGSLPRLEAHLSKKELELAKNSRKKHKKRRKRAERKIKPLQANVPRTQERTQGNPTTPVQELLPIESGTEDSSSVGILYGKSKKPLDLSKLPKPPQEDKK